MYIAVCWEDAVIGGTTVARGSINRSSASNPSTRGGRGRGRGRGRSNTSGNDVTFVSATGEPISGRCFICGDPSHFANACPSRGR
ncbi:hypothetical protein RD792_017011 [Penstemon davidsonii]|uniref:CCHC-type domain-containing protein n=1 Tax=Penstemon davidsonii TaxID=160366 RepID=A0ABR0CKV7_9LAMI|nr:hypothetical protein RD792_017011 [Penstemon davidsonii]